MKVFLFGKHRQLFCETTGAVWRNDDVRTEARLLAAPPTLTVRSERLSHFHQHKITALGVVTFLATSVSAALLCSTLGVSSCLFMMFAYSFLLAPLLQSLFGPLPLHHEDRWFDFVAAFRRERDIRFSHWAELLETKLFDPLAVVIVQLKTYQRLTVVLTFMLVHMGSALLGAAVGGGLSDTGYVVLFVWLLLLLVSTIFVFCPHYWLTQIKAQLEKRKSERA